MALVCPVGHPPGTGTSFCRLCGRDYVEVEDAPASGALARLATDAQADAPAAPPLAAPPLAAPPPPQAPAHEPSLAQVFAMPPASQPLEVVADAPLPDLHVVPPTPMEASASHEPTHGGGLQVQLPLVAVPAQGEVPAVEAPAATEAAAEPEPEPEASSPARAAVDRTVLLAATAAGFVGGAVSAVVMHSLLG